ncbi:MAG TPA: trehalose-6-phosphate synthase [Steroidobacteraceae bacterium]|jgi:trehalose 6-phosphate synthase
MGRLVAVSNRVTLPRQDAPAGGLAVGLLSALKDYGGGVWFGWSGKTAADPHPRASLAHAEGIDFATVDLPSDKFNAYYDGFCNGSLWPVHHYFPSSFRYDAAEYEAYLAINRFYAEALRPQIREDDVIWIHDYQLFPLGHMLRAAGVKNPIGFFLHIPFPNIAVYRLLPPYEELIDCLCDYDLVGFQTEEDHDGFLSAVEEIHGIDFPRRASSITVGKRRLQLGVFPIGVDVAAINETAKRARTEDGQVTRLAASLLGRQLLLGVDRLDYSKGLIERFNSYQALLEQFPDLQGNVTFIQVAPLSRINVAAYAEIRDALERTAGRLNGRFADADWTPIRYLNKDFSHSTLSGFLRIADVAVVTPVRDGMNLVAKEYIAAQDPETPGVLVLSSLAGAAKELAQGALLVNPYDSAAVARTLKQALEMPLDERRTRHRTMLSALGRNSIADWHKRFMTALGEARAP